MNPLDNLRARIEVFLELNGETILDSRLARVLEEVERRGSLLAACRAAGAPYSRTWEKITRIEEILGAGVLEAKRGGVGGGGARLTRLGKMLLQRYREASRELEGGLPALKSKGLPDLMIAGSHDPALELLLGILRERSPRLDVEVAWLGSAGGLAALMLGDAHIAGSHLLDPESGLYNIPFLKRYWLEGRVYVVRGYRRELGLVYRPDMEVSSVSELLEGRLRLINRNPGSGTRVFLDHLLRQAALDKGMEAGEILSRVRGYEQEARTHVEVARKVASGEGDVGIAVRYAAELYGLKFTRLVWEFYDFIVSRDAMRMKAINLFLETLRSKKFREILSRLPGYRVSEELGSIIYR